MTKTLAQFKRDITAGVHIQYVSNERHTQDGWVPDIVPQHIQGVRYISYHNTTGFYIKVPVKNGEVKKASFQKWPKANDLSYSDDTFTIIDRHRDGTPYARRTYEIIRYK